MSKRQWHRSWSETSVGIEPAAADHRSDDTGRRAGRFGVTLLVLSLATVGLVPVAAGAQDDLSPGCRALSQAAQGAWIPGHSARWLVVSDTTFAAGEAVTIHGDFNDGSLFLADADGFEPKATLAATTHRLRDGRLDTLRYTFRGDETGVSVGVVADNRQGNRPERTRVWCGRGGPSPTCGGHPVTILANVSQPRLIVNGTKHRDVISTAAATNRARARDDEVRGWLGNDVICTGRGADTIRGGPGHDTIYGGRGNDTISGGLGTDTIYGGMDNDTISGGPSHDTIHAGGGRDTANGNSGDDFVHGGPGNDTLEGGLGKDRVWGGEHFDKCWGEQLRCEIKHRTRPDGRGLS